MAMAAAIIPGAKMASATHVSYPASPSPSSSLCHGRGGAFECRSRVELGAPSVSPAAASAVACRENRSCGIWSSGLGDSGGSLSLSLSSRSCNRREWRWQAVAEQLQAGTEESSEDVFSSDSIAIYFEAEGSLSESSVGKLTSILEAVEGVSNVNVTAASDGTATVKLTKQMNVQATGVASGLVEVLMSGGFKMQALNLGFDEDDGEDEDFYDYDLSASTEEEAEA